MKYARNLSLVLPFLWLYSAGVMAVVHEVTVGDNFFEPSDLTINVGDTVRWSYEGNRLHDVTADDFSWASATSSSFVYERTFETLGEVLYHCTVHSSPGRDINTFQNGRINVVESDPGPSVLINIGMMDAWLNQDTAGQGMLITVWEQIQYMFLAWFTFDTERPPEDAPAILGEPGHRWLTAQGSFSGDTAVLNVYLTSGGIFDASEPPAITDPDPIGTMTIQWTDCNTATLTYDIPSLGLMDSMPIVRILAENAAVCEAGQPTP